MPGVFLHPTRDPAGHSYRSGEVVARGGSEAAAGDALESWRFGVDLFNRFYFWEAHEAWEALWRAAPVGSARRDLLHGLIQIAAALLKVHLGRVDAARRLASAGMLELRQAATAEPVVLNVTVVTLVASFEVYFVALPSTAVSRLDRTVPVVRLDGARPA